MYWYVIHHGARPVTAHSKHSVPSNGLSWVGFRRTLFVFHGAAMVGSERGFGIACSAGPDLLVLYSVITSRNETTLRSTADQ